MRDREHGATDPTSMEFRQYTRSSRIEVAKIEEYTGLKIENPPKIVFNPDKKKLFEIAQEEAKGNWLVGVMRFVMMQEPHEGAFSPTSRSIFVNRKWKFWQYDIVNDSSLNYLKDTDDVTLHEAGHVWWEDNANFSVTRKSSVESMLLYRILHEGAAVAIGERTCRGIIQNEIAPFFARGGVSNAERKLEIYDETKDNAFQLGNFDAKSDTVLADHVELLQKFIAVYKQVTSTSFVERMHGLTGFISLADKYSAVVRGLYVIGHEYFKRVIASHPDMAFADVMKMIAANRPQTLEEVLKEGRIFSRRGDHN